MESMAFSPERDERRRRQKELAEQLKASGALDGIFAKIDAGEPLTGESGLLGGMLKAALERGLETLARPESLAWEGLNKPHRQGRRWVTAFSPEQISHRLMIDFPEDESRRISHEAIYRSVVHPGP